MGTVPNKLLNKCGLFAFFSFGKKDKMQNIIRLYMLFAFVLIACFQTSAMAQEQPRDATGKPPEIAQVTMVTPPFIEQFRKDYLSYDPNRIMKWMTPKRGLVEDGILRTYDDTRKKMLDFQKEMKGMEADMLFSRGFYTGSTQSNDFYKAFYQVSIGSGKLRQTINMIAVFEKIDAQWFLVQTQNLRLSHDVASPTKDALALETNMLVMGDRPLLDYAGVTYSKKPRRFSSVAAQRKITPVLLNFFTRISGDFGAQLDWAKSIHTKFINRNIYIFSVTDDEPEFLEPYLESGKWKGDIVVLLDKDSLIHHDLDVDIHPYLMLFDHHGVLRLISRGYNKESLGLVEKIMDDIINEADRARTLEKEGGAPIHKN